MTNATKLGKYYCFIIPRNAHLEVSVHIY